MRAWAGLAAGLPLLTACAVRHTGDAPFPSDDAGEPPVAAVQVWPQEDSTSAAPDAGAKSAESETREALEAVEAARDEQVEKNYLIPGVEIVVFEALLNQYDRHFVSEAVYGTDSSSIRENLHRGWVIDKDPFSTNQFAHPYTGGIYHGFARSTGHDYWEALVYDFAGSALWEVAGETDPPSLNDQINTTFAGSFLGEALFRTANLVLRNGEGRPGVFRRMFAGLICPSAEVNRLSFGRKYETVDAGDVPPSFWWIGLGARRNTTLNDLGVLTDVNRDHGVGAFSLDYGMPGTPGYTYTRPFDYFHFEATATTSAHAIPENIMVRGLLYGTDYTSGPDYRGIWGLYGSYDYFSPEVFKVSSTALSIGTTGQYLMSRKFALQGTIMAGGGYTAAGTAANASTDRDYRYGAGPQGLVALRLVYGDLAMLDVTANRYLISGTSGSSRTSGNEDVLRAQVSFTLRVVGQHGIGIQYVESRRDPRFSGISNRRQSLGAVSIFYTLIGDEEFGVVRR